MSRMNKRFPRLEHCCEGFCENIAFHPEIYLFLAALKQEKVEAEFYNGSLINEKDILEQLEKEKPKKIFYYVNTPYINDKREFMERLSKISKLYLIAVPYFWREKILKEFKFVEDVYYDGEKALKVDVSNVEIDYDKINLTPYLNSRNYAFPVIVSKYCPYSCTYCVAQKTGLMDRDLSLVKKELEYLKNKGFKRVALLGNNLTINKKKFIEICKIMKELDLEWSGDGRINHMDKEIYDALENSKGTLLFGVESANQEILNKIQKNLTIKQIIDNSVELNKRKIPFRYTFMFGFPWDSEKTAEEMIYLRKKISALNYHCLFLSPLPGTPLFEEMKKLKLIDEDKLDFVDFKESYLTPFAETLFLNKECVQKNVKKIMISGALNQSVIKHIFKTRKISEYPKMILKAARIVILGKRNLK